MIGALVGINKIPEHMKQRVLEFDCTTQGRFRPEFLSVKKHGLENIKSLISIVKNRK